MEEEGTESIPVFVNDEDLNMTEIAGSDQSIPQFDGAEDLDMMGGEDLKEV